jgi:hypothetical protein
MVLPLPFFALPSIVASDGSLFSFTTAISKNWFAVLVPAGYALSAALVVSKVRWAMAGGIYFVSYVGFWMVSLTSGDPSAKGPAGPSLLVLVALVEVVFPLLAMLTVLLSFAANRNSGGGR